MKKSSPKIGQLIKTYRIRAQLTQKNLADLLGYEIPQFISLMENGHSKIPLYILERLSSILKIPEKKILDILVSVYRDEVIQQLSSTKKRNRPVA